MQKKEDTRSEKTIAIAPVRDDDRLDQSASGGDEGKSVNLTYFGINVELVELTYKTNENSNNRQVIPDSQNLRIALRKTLEISGYSSFILGVLVVCTIV